MSIQISAPSLGCGQCGCPLTRPFQRRRTAGGNKAPAGYDAIGGVFSSVASPVQTLSWRDLLAERCLVCAYPTASLGMASVPSSYGSE